MEIICGVDEAGRGPLAGDVYAAAVILDIHNPIDGLNDSKKLTAAQREKLFNKITQHARAYAIMKCSVAEIDSLNILQATLLAMQRAVNQLSIVPTLVLVDGNRAPQLAQASKTIVKGDTLIQEISAASILAKVARDQSMLELDKLHPEYGFAKHKGYGTSEHIRAIYEHGILAGVHRKSFAPVRHML